MIKNIIYIIIIFLFFNLFSFLYAEEKTNSADRTAIIPEKKEKILIYDFEDKNTVNNYAYLSSIIAGSIAADLNRIGGFEAHPLYLRMDYLDPDASGKAREDFTRDLADKAKEFSTEFLLSGSYVVDGTKITISCQIFDVARQKLIYIDKTENKISAVLVEMIEEIADKINTELTKASNINKENKRKEEEEKKNRISPFLGFYNSLSGITFGINFGKVVFHGDWADIIEYADQTSLYLSYELNNINSLKKTAFFKNTSLTGRFDHFSERSGDFKDTRDRYLNLSIGSLSLSYLFRFNSFSNIALSAGCGLSQVELEISPERNELEEITSPGSTDKKNCLFYTTALSLNIYFSNLKIETGFAYNYVQYSPKHINYSVIYFGLGYRI